MIHRGWLVDFAEKDSEGVQLTTHLYAQSPIYKSERNDQARDIQFVDRAQDALLLRSRFEGDFGPLCASMIKMGADPWQRWEDRSARTNYVLHGLLGGGQVSLLHYSIMKNDLMFLRFVLTQPNRPDISGWKFTQKDSVIRDASESRLLREEHKDGRSLLHIAANQIQSESTAIVKELVRAGQDTNGRDGFGRTPLFYARSIKMVKQLLSLGADPFVVDKNGVSVNQYWEVLLGTTKAAADFHSQVLAIVSQTTSPEQLRQAQRLELLKSLCSGNKTTTTNLFRKAKFSYDQKFKVDQSGCEWNLITPVLLRSDIDKATPIVSWLSSRVPWEEDLGNGLTNLGISMFIPGFSSFALHKGVQKNSITPGSVVPQMISSINTVFSNSWVPHSVELRMMGSWFSWCLLPHLMKDIENSHLNPSGKISGLRPKVLSFLPELARGKDSVELMEGISQELSRPENLTNIGLLGINSVHETYKESDKTRKVFFNNFSGLISLLGHCHRKWKEGEVEYAMPGTVLGVLSLGLFASEANTSKWMPGGMNPQWAKLSFEGIRDAIMEDFPGMLSDSQVNETQVSQMDRFLARCEGGQGVGILNAKTAIRRHMLMVLAKPEAKQRSESASPRM